MPWSSKQMKVWRAIEHGWNPPGDKFEGISPQKAGEMAKEGVKKARIGRKVKGGSRGN